MRRVCRGLSPLLLLVLSSGCAKEFVRVTVESNPPSAEVWLGEEQRDSTPCTLLFDSPGTYDLFVKKAGYLPVKRLVTVFESKDGAGNPYLQVNPERMTVTLDPVAPGGTGTPGGPSTDGSGGAQ